MAGLFIPRANAFSQNPLDRLDARRRDTAWILSGCQDPASLFVPVWRGRNLIRRMEGASPEPAYLPATEVASWLADAPWAFLGSHDGQNFYAVDFSAYDDPLPPIDATGFEDLRRMGGLLTADSAAILAHARGLMHWRTRKPVLQYLRRCLHPARRRPCHAMRRLRRPSFPPHRSGRHHARHS